VFFHLCRAIRKKSPLLAFIGVFFLCHRYVRVNTLVQSVLIINHEFYRKIERWDYISVACKFLALSAARTRPFSHSAALLPLRPREYSSRRPWSRALIIQVSENSGVLNSQQRRHCGMRASGYSRRNVAYHRSDLLCKF